MEKSQIHTASNIIPFARNLDGLVVGITCMSNGVISTNLNLFTGLEQSSHCHFCLKAHDLGSIMHGLPYLLSSPAPPPIPIEQPKGKAYSPFPLFSMNACSPPNWLNLASAFFLVESGYLSEFMTPWSDSRSVSESDS